MENYKERIKIKRLITELQSRYTEKRDKLIKQCKSIKRLNSKTVKSLDNLVIKLFYLRTCDKDFLEEKELFC